MAKSPFRADAEKMAQAILELENGGTKKRACEIIGIAYNTTRLGTLIEDHLSRQVRDKEIRAKKRTQAVTNEEAAAIIIDYLNGESYDGLSDRHHRSVGMIKNIVEKNGANLRIVGSVNAMNPPALPEACITEEVEEGEYVWVCKYGCLGQVVGFYKGAVKVQVLGEGIQQKCYQPVWELGSLRHLQALGIDLNRFIEYTKGDEAKVKLYEAFKAAAKRDKEEGSRK